MRKIIIFILFMSVLFACSNKSKTNNYEIIPQDIFTNILIDIHKADAYLQLNQLNDLKLKTTDSLSYYNYIFKKYNVSRIDFYNSLEYYIDNIEVFVKIQEKVLDSLKREQELIDSLKNISLNTNDLWNLKKTWKLPEEFVTYSIPFNFNIHEKGTYTLYADIFSFSDDMSKSLKMYFKIHFTDSSFLEKKINIIPKKNSWKEYSISISTPPNKTPVAIEGEILSHSSTTTFMHVHVKNIKLLFTKK